MVKPVYLLDTNILSEPTKPIPNKFVLEKLNREVVRCAMSAITYHELFYGLQLVQNEKRKLYLERYLFNVVKPLFPILNYDGKAAEIHSTIRGKLKSMGITVPDLDAQIASIAIVNNLILVTRNQKDFHSIATVSTLMLENWFDGEDN